MNILAFDSSLGALSAAVRWRGADGGWLLRDAHEVRERGHAERLMPMISKLMGDAVEFAEGEARFAHEL